MDWTSGHERVEADPRSKRGCVCVWGVSVDSGSLKEGQDGRGWKQTVVPLLISSSSQWVLSRWQQKPGLGGHN